MTVRSRIAVGLLAASAAGLGFITAGEKRVLTAYADPAHGWAVPTICDGHTGPDVYRGLVATNGMCDSWRAADAAKSVAAIKRCSPKARLHQHEFDALVSFTHNVGTGAYCSSTLAKKINANDYSGAAYEFRKWNKVCKRGVCSPVKGLTNRRAAEERLFRTGEYL